METFKVHFLPHNRSIQVQKGETLLRAALEAGVHINASCGGAGVCGKCRVLIEGGNVEGGEWEMLTEEEITQGYRLACKASVIEDTRIRIPVESQTDNYALENTTSTRHTARILQPSLEQALSSQPPSPPVEKIYIELPPPNPGDNVPDSTRLLTTLKNEYNEQNVSLDLDLVRKLSDVLRQQDFAVTLTLLRPVSEHGKTQILDVAPGDTRGGNYGFAIDIGTTTVQVRLLDQTTGEIIAEGASFNAQISYGEDIISRIITAEKGDGLEKLHSKVVVTINTLTEKLLNEADIALDDIGVMVVAGNTTMTQLLLQINPRYIRRSPYVPTGGIYPPVRAREIGLHSGEKTQLLLFPQVSSYVGGDIVAGILASRMHRTEELTLFLDIGTNAEMAIGNRDWLACASCSAGPAFEGGGIEFGMRAAKGAIEDFSINSFTLEPMIVTIGNVKPKGICGSGLITMVATLQENGVIDSGGKFHRKLNSPRIRKTKDVWEYVIAWENETQIGRDIVLTEIDIENLIRAKGTIYSGCMTLLQEIGTPLEAIEKIVLAGGFGSYIDLEKAMTIGLLPELPPEKVVFIGNSSLLGAQFCCLANQLRSEVLEITSQITNFELSETPSYMDQYVAALFLPHTDLSLFPTYRDRHDQRKIAN